MSDDLCQCPACGRMHKNLGFGKPPEAVVGASLLRPAEQIGAPSSSDLYAALTTLRYQLSASWNSIFADGETVHAEALRYALASADVALAKARAA